MRLPAGPCWVCFLVGFLVWGFFGGRWAPVPAMQCSNFGVRGGNYALARAAGVFCQLFRFGLRLLRLRFQSIRGEQRFGGFCLANLHLTSTPHRQPSPKHYRNKKKPQSVPHFSFSLYGLTWSGSQLRPCFLQQHHWSIAVCLVTL